MVAMSASFLRVLQLACLADAIDDAAAHGRLIQGSKNVAATRRSRSLRSNEPGKLQCFATRASRVRQARADIDEIWFVAGRLGHFSQYNSDPITNERERNEVTRSWGSNVVLG
jgi:hypothetical protein